MEEICISDQFIINNYSSIINDSLLKTVRWKDSFEISLESKNVAYLFFPFNINFTIKPIDDKFDTIDAILELKINNLNPQNSLCISKTATFRYPNYAYLVQTGLTQEDFSNQEEGWLDNDSIIVDFKCSIISFHKKIDTDDDSDITDSSEEEIVKKTQHLTNFYDFEILFSHDHRFVRKISFKHFDVEFTASLLQDFLEIGIKISSLTQCTIKYGITIIDSRSNRSRTNHSKIRNTMLQSHGSHFWDYYKFSWDFSSDELLDDSQGWQFQPNEPLIIRFDYFFVNRGDEVFKYPHSSGTKPSLSYQYRTRLPSPINLFSSQAVQQQSSIIPQFRNTSKEDTGYVGLQNQGATCYMNSLLQSLYHIPSFRRIVYNIPLSGTEDINTCFPLCMQRLFAKMQFSDTPCSTKELTTSFGWNDRETFTQHDVQEFCTVLLDKLSEKLQGTPLENSLPNLLSGEFKSYIRCINVEFESSKVETFFDLSMVVQGIPNLQESFCKYIESEQLNGNNQYRTDEFGLQDALMGTEFIKFPPVLHLHLRRFQFDYNTLRMTKINDKFEFPISIDIKPYIIDSKEEDYTYDLYGVLVHNGRIGGGHYYAYLRTSTSPQWYKFNDSHVTKATVEEAVNDNFGGYNSIDVEKTYSAYMLIYIRRSESEELMKPVDDNEVPERLINYAKGISTNSTQPFNDADQGNPANSLKSIEVTIYHENGLMLNSLQNEPGYRNDNLKKVFTITNETLITRNMIYQKISQEYSLNLDVIRLWEFTNQPYRVFLDNEDEISENITLFLQIKEETSPVSLISAPESLYALLSVQKAVIFAKFFNPILEFPVQYLKSFELSVNDELSEIFPSICKFIGLPEDTPLLVFDESNGMYIQMDPNHKLPSTKCLVFQLMPGEILPTGTSFEWMTSEKVIADGIFNSFDEKHKKEFQKKHGIIDCKHFNVFRYDEVMGTKPFNTVDKYFENLSYEIHAKLFDYFDLQHQIPPTNFFFSNTISLLELQQFISQALQLNNIVDDETHNDLLFDPSQNTLNIYRAENEGPKCDQPSQSPLRILDCVPNLSSEFFRVKKTSLFFQFIPGIPQELFIDNYFSIRLYISTQPYIITGVYAYFFQKNISNFEDEENQDLFTLYHMMQYVVSAVNSEIWVPPYDEINDYEKQIEIDENNAEQSELDKESTKEDDNSLSDQTAVNIDDSPNGKESLHIPNDIESDDEISERETSNIQNDHHTDDLSLRIDQSTTLSPIQDTKNEETDTPNQLFNINYEENDPYQLILKRSVFSIIQNHIITSTITLETIINQNLTLRMDFFDNHDISLLKDGGVIMPVSQISENDWNPFGLPFNIIIEKDEKFETVKKKLFTAMSAISNISDNEFLNLSFYFGGADRYEAERAGREKKFLWNGINAYEETKKTQNLYKKTILYVLYKSKNTTSQSIKIYN